MSQAHEVLDTAEAAYDLAHKLEEEAIPVEIAVGELVDKCNQIEQTLAELEVAVGEALQAVKDLRL